MLLIKRRDRKGEEILSSAAIFWILNIIFFLILAAFIYKVSSGAMVYEQAYSKKIAFVIDESAPETEVYINLGKGIDIAKKNQFPPDRIVEINNTVNTVLVRLDRRGGYIFRFFKDYQVDVLSISDNYLKLKISGGVNAE